jgi:Mn-dependent DtxR family transcriptional regulator
MELTTAYLRYLLAIDALSREGGAVASSAVAAALGVQRPSVARMLKNLSERGLVEKEPYGKVRLTPAGEVLARRYRTRLETLQRSFCRPGFSLDPEEALRAAWAVMAALPEHYGLSEGPAGAETGSENRE